MPRRAPVTALSALLFLLTACDQSLRIPTAPEPTAPQFSVTPSLTTLGDAVITSSAFTGERPALEEGSGNLQALSELPGGQLEGEVVHVGRGCDGDAYLADPAGAIALIERGFCFFREKVLRAMSAGATGVVFYQNEGENAEALPPWSVGEPPIALPGVFVQRSTGLLLRDGAAPVTAVIRPGVVENLEWAVQALADAGILNHGQATSLALELELAQLRIADGNPGGARGVLRAFISAVQGLVTAGVLSLEDGHKLVTAAEALIASLDS
jgi:hypothetical protein